MPTDKRQRQKEGRRNRMEARRKVEKRRQLVRRTLIVVAVAAVVTGSVFLLIPNSTTTTTTTTTSTTTTTTPTSTHTVTQAQIAASNALNARISAVVNLQQTLTASQKKSAQSLANSKAVAAGCPASPSTRVNTLTWTTAPKMTIDTASTYKAVVTTDLGPFTILLDTKAAPITVNNFVFLAQHGFYNCVIFHRVIPLFMNQSGDPTGTGSGGPGYTIPDEDPSTASNPSYQYPPGSVAMANTGSPNSGGSQFFIVTGASGEALPATYSLFGQVISGIDTVAMINGQGSAAGVPPDVTHRILRVTITKS